MVHPPDAAERVSDALPVHKTRAPRSNSATDLFVPELLGLGRLHVRAECHAREALSWPQHGRGCVSKQPPGRLQPPSGYRPM